MNLWRLRWPALACALSISIASPRGAAAEGWDELTRQATRVDPAGLAALFWSQVETCDKLGDDLARRQCKAVKQARRAQVAAATFVIAAPPGAVHGGVYDARGKSLPVAIEACVACGDPSVGGAAGEARPLVTGKGRRSVAGGVLRSAPLGQVAVPLADAAAAEAWKRDVLPRLRAEFVVKVPDRLDTWRAGDRSGYGVEVIGFRVIDPCDGKVVSARPEAGPVQPERAGCPAAPAPAPVAAVAPTPAKPEATGPEHASSNEINQAMAPVRDAAQKCFESYGVPGSLVLRFTFDRAGKITALAQEGDYAETPMGGCVERAARKVEFPRSRKRSTTVALPITLE